MPETRTFRWTNAAKSPLNGAINSVVGSLVVDNGSTFPQPGAGEIFTVVLRNDAIGAFEVMNVTARSGNTFTVERGAEGTVAASWPDDTVVSHSLTAGWYQARGFSVPTPTVEYIDSLCSYAVGGSSPVVYSLPGSAQVGDFLLLTATVVGSTDTVTPPTGWKMLSMVNTAGSSDDYHLRDTGTLTALFAYRFMELGDTTVSVPVTGTAGTIKNGGCIHAFRGVDIDRPVPQMVMENMRVSGDMVLDVALHTPVMNSVAFGSRVVAFLYTPPSTPVIYDGTGVASIHTTEFFEAEDLVDAGNAHGYLSMVFVPTQDEFENLLQYTFRNFDSWPVKTNITLSDAELSNPVRTRTDPSTGGPARHEISQTVTLTAGHTYSLMAYTTKDAAGNVDDMYLSIDDGGGGGARGEIGATYDKGTNNWTNTGDFSAGGFDFEYTRRTGTAGSSTDVNNAICAMFTAAITGTHTVRLGYSMTAGTPVSTYASTSDGGFLWQLILADGQFFSPAWRELGTAATPVSDVNGTFGRLVRGHTAPPSAETRSYGFEIRAAGQTPDLVRLSQGHTDDCEFKSGRLGIADVGLSGTAVVGAVATGCVDKFQNAAGGKFYYEVTCGPTIWESPSSNETYIGLAVPWVRGAFKSTLGTGMSQTQQGMFVFGNNGNVYNDGVLVATIATPTDTYTTGDIVGVSVDFLTNEIKFYKNGVLVYTTTLAVAHRDIPLRAVLLSTTTLSRGRELTASFAGPFSALPSGFSAYDWENS